MGRLPSIHNKFPEAESIACDMMITVQPSLAQYSPALELLIVGHAHVTEAWPSDLAAELFYEWSCLLNRWHLLVDLIRDLKRKLKVKILTV